MAVDIPINWQRVLWSSGIDTRHKASEEHWLISSFKLSLLSVQSYARRLDTWLGIGISLCRKWIAEPSIWWPEQRQEISSLDECVTSLCLLENVSRALLNWSAFLLGNETENLGLSTEGRKRPSSSFEKRADLWSRDLRSRTRVHSRPEG